MKHTLIMWLAPLRKNAFMRAADLRPEGKWYCELLETHIETASAVDEPYLLNIINQSRVEQEQQGWWVPAIGFQGDLIVHPDVRILSDGRHEIFI